jgi:protein SCO1
MAMTSKRVSRVARKASLVFSLGLAFCLWTAGCGQQRTPASQSAAENSEQRYLLKGTVRAIDRSQQRIVIDHEDIPGFMAAMTMPYPVVEPKLLDVAAPGDQITADVVVRDNAAHLEHIVVVRKADGPLQ